jgi:hypothetical protein
MSNRNGGNGRPPLGESPFLRESGPQQQQQQQQQHDPHHIQARILYCPAEERTARELSQLNKSEREQVWADMTGHPETQHYRMTAESDELVTRQIQVMTEEIQHLLEISSSSSSSSSSSATSASVASSSTSSSNTTISYSGYRLACQQNQSFVESQKILFLRAEDFQPKAAATRMLQFFDWTLRLFGFVHRPIQLSDLSMDDLESLAAGAMQLLPVTDHAGRAIIVTRQANYKYKEHDNMVRSTTRTQCQTSAQHCALHVSS